MNSRKILFIGFIVLSELALSGCGAGGAASQAITLTPSAAASPSRISSEATDTPLPPAIPLQATPQNILAGGTVQSGPFVFDLRLFNEADLNQNPVATSLYSDMNGIGAYLYWIYQGSDAVGPLQTYWGTLPRLDVLQQETYSIVHSGDSGGRTGGILLPGGFFIPGESKAGDRVQLALQVHTPDGDYGAVLAFTLVQGARGFEPTDITVEALKPGNL